MQKICWLGNDYFGSRLLDAGVELLCHIDAPADGVLSWQDICQRADFQPDLVIITDTGPRPFVLGVEEFPCLSIFYSVNPHSYSWHGPYAQAFDACVVAQESYTRRLSGPFLDSSHIWWLPPFARSIGGERERLGDCICIADGPVSPGQKAFLQALQEQLPHFHITEGDASRLLASHSMVLHLGGERPGLDFRIFEAMAAGACLILPRVGQGLEKLFVDGEHLLSFAPGDVGDAAYRIEFLQENPDLVAYIARTGQEEVASKHLLEHRMWEMVDHLYELAAEDVDALIRRRLGRAPEIRQRCLAVLYQLCAREGGSDRSAWEMAANGSFGLKGASQARD